VDLVERLFLFDKSFAVQKMLPVKMALVLRGPSPFLFPRDDGRKPLKR